MNVYGFPVIIINIGIFSSILYWGSFFLSYFFSKPGKNYLFRDYYECGFKETPDIRLGLDISFSILGLIFLIYEFEIILFIPVFLNVYGLSYEYIFVVVFSFFLLVLSYWYEWDAFALYWNY
jgi:NADH:ubiquinone oxidoreductase subunit 3 (subunit A)